ncbi:glycoside hydrolase family 5 protein [Fibrella aquatilis]|uniref:Cellulase family glycosylhydrolase n=1 Tax=Fibrella aquatilis TaxID=2817059 RepID=A0A939GAK1_9BACT|nr:cellulase family glycosylhydrolase [Fibrella aquatilis]MBO0933111.1 cellulase family glycosylhydrolase [Fibrella aquatilis]
MKHLLLVLGLLALLTACKKPANDPLTADPTDADTVSSAQLATLVHRDGRSLVVNGQPIRLNGVAFGNWVWDNSATPPTRHHNEQDFARLQQSGLNCVRFYLNYRYFEDDNQPYVYRQAGWDWLDQNIAWAKKYGVYLILNMHVPQGGYQSQGKGGALWDVVENQNRLTKLWRAIARRYRAEPAIAGFDLLNEPVTTQSIDQWKNLAQRITTAIREVDKGHLVVVERLNAVAGDWRDYNGERNMFLVNDANVMYQFHTYDPFEFTHQTFDWAGRSPTEFERYPDETKLSITDATWYSAVFTNPALPAGTTDWAYYEGVKFTVNDPKIKIGQAVCQASTLGAGKAYFDELVVREYAPDGSLVRTVLTANMDNKDGWYFWSKANTGSAAIVDAGKTGKGVVIAQTTDDANLGSSSLPFLIRQGYSYQVSGWMRGEAVPTAATVRLRVDFQTTQQPILARNKEYLRQALAFYADWGKKTNVPIYLGEYGAGAPCFRDGRGGAQWVTDMIDLNREFGFHTTYHDYHEDGFGWYFGYNALPDPANANTALIELFKQKFGR